MKHRRSDIARFTIGYLESPPRELAVRSLTLVASCDRSARLLAY